MSKLDHEKNSRKDRLIKNEVKPEYYKKLENTNKIIKEEIKIDEEETVIPFEPLYEDVKNNVNEVWYMYEPKILKIISGLSYWKNFDKYELIQQAYVYFVEFSNRYDPYYEGNFIPFDKFLFRNLIIKLRAYIQRYYFKTKREQPTEFSEYGNASTKNDMQEIDDKIYQEYIYSLIDKRQQQILDLSMKGYKQQEIANKLGISQSRVSVIKNKTLLKLRKELEGTTKKKDNRMWRR